MVLRRFILMLLENTVFRRSWTQPKEYVGDETPLHVSFDIDSLNPEWAPSTVFPVAPGLTRDECVYIAQRLSDTGSLVAMDLAEINPQIESSK
ncbi:unnamed protein product [Aspergillus oryzae]|nr:unnamed protein product [Aspergillus oryzae]GMF94901.1 unnamed protein product [Aspergillus oryzae]